MEDRRSERTLPGDYLVGIHLLISVASAIVIWARILEIAGCAENECDYPLVGSSTRTFWWMDFLVFIVAFGLYMFLRTRIRWSWIIPASGGVLALIGFLIANIVLSGALS